MSPAIGRLFPWILRQRTLILVVLLGAMAAGAYAMVKLPSGIYPELDYPRIVVVARAGDDPPDLLQATIVRPIEEALATVPGVRRIRTKIIRGSAEIGLQFSEGTDMWRALQLTDTALGNARQSLPLDTEIETEKVTPADFPILSFNVTGGDSVTRRETAEFLVRPALSRIAGVGRVEVVGGDPREIEVSLDPWRLAALHMRPAEAARRVSEGLVRRAVGRFDEFQQSVTATASGPSAGTEALAGLAISGAPNGAVVLGDIAKVSEGSPDRTVAVHGPRGDAVQVSISRMVGASAPEVVSGVESTLARLRLPEGIHLEEVYNQGRLIRDAMLGIREAILVGIALTVGVLALFLRNIRAGLLAALAVPVTLVITFLVMAALGQTLNLMSLGGMAVAIGLVIDDAIVVIEAIERHIEAGAAPALAARQGLEDITSPVIGTTITTVVVLLPLAFLSGIAGSFFRALAVTLASAVVISMLFALFALPLLAATFLKPRTIAADRPRPRLDVAAAYAAWISRAVRRPGPILAAGLLTLVLGGAVYARIPSGFLPEMDEGAFVLDYFLPAGTSLQATDAAAARIEGILAQTPDIVNWARRTGTELGPATATQVNRGDIAILLRPRRERRDTDDVIDELRHRIQTTLPGVRIEFVQILEDVLGDLSGNPRPIEVKIFGENQKVLARLAAQAARRLEGVPTLVDYYSGIEDEAPVLHYDIDSDAASRAGLSTSDVADDLATALRGTIVGSLPRLDRLIPVRVHFSDDVRFRVDLLGALPVALRDGQAPISRLAPIVRGMSPSLLFRENLSPAALGSGDVEGGNLGGLARDIRNRLAALPLPAGYSLEVGGRVEGQARAFEQMIAVFSLGLFAVFTVLVAQFRSARAALLVLLTVPLAVSGGLLFLAATRVTLNVSSLMGLVLLIGLVVKNGILLIQNTLLQREQGLSVPDALAAAGRRRLRPILMTTLCTVFGLLPLALSLGTGSELQRPLAVVVIGGLTFSTIATLLILPTLAGIVLPAGSR